MLKWMILYNAFLQSSITITVECIQCSIISWRQKLSSSPWWLQTMMMMMRILMMIESNVVNRIFSNTLRRVYKIYTFFLFHSLFSTWFRLGWLEFNLVEIDVCIYTIHITSIHDMPKYITYSHQKKKQIESCLFRHFNYFIKKN